MSPILLDFTRMTDDQTRITDELHTSVRLYDVALSVSFAALGRFFAPRADTPLFKDLPSRWQQACRQAALVAIRWVNDDARRQAARAAKDMAQQARGHLLIRLKRADEQGESVSERLALREEAWQQYADCILAARDAVLTRETLQPFDQRRPGLSVTPQELEHEAARTAAQARCDIARFTGGEITEGT